MTHRTPRRPRPTALPPADVDLRVRMSRRADDRWAAMGLSDRLRALLAFDDAVATGRPIPLTPPIDATVVAYNPAGIPPQ